MTFAMIFGIPIMQLLLFGYVINGDPRFLPAGIINSDTGIHGRTVLQGLKNSTFFKFTHIVPNEAEGRRLLAQGEVQFVVNIPPNFTRDLQRGKRPTLLVEADATDPAAIAGCKTRVLCSPTQRSTGRVDSAVVNTHDALVARARRCEAERGLLANFVAVNHYNIGDLVAAVDTLNGVS